MNIMDRLWLKVNKRPPGRLKAYLAMGIPWVLQGVLLSMLIGTIAVVLEGYLPPKILVPIIIFIVFYIGFIVIVDSKWGYIDAIYQHNLKRWKEHRKRLLGEE